MMASHARKTKKAPIVFKVLIVISVLFIIFCLFMIGKELLGYYQASNIYDKITDSAYVKTNSTNASGGVVDGPLARSIDFQTLKSINPDIVAWIAQDGTVIDYPIVQGTDNDTYLHRLVDGTYSELGTIFMESNNNANMTDTNNIFYGHHAIDGSMFSSISNYKDPDYYKQHPLMTLYAPTGTYQIQLFAGYIGDANVDFMTFRTTNFSSDAAFMEYIDNTRSNSTFQSDVTVQPGDQIVSLCTCSYEFDNARYILHGKMVKIS